MCHNVKVIIGANYGDEGKGLATHYFSRSKDSCLNILYNGGGQRGHTVDFKDGTKHVFHHFGSGTFDGASTLFHGDFILNPMVFCQEWNELPNQIINNMVVFGDLRCKFVTPYDMMINQIVELSRGATRHGSCGHGIWETFCRYNNNRMAFSIADAINLNKNEFMKYMSEIALTYAPSRLKNDYGITTIPTEYETLLHAYDLAEKYYEDFRFMIDNVIWLNKNEIKGLYKNYDQIIFEGGQGLALDKDNIAEYPHVTASSTGSYIPIKDIVESGFDLNKIDIEIVYVSRTYFTRHGEGFLPGECRKEDISSLIEIDMTNQQNEWQGFIRYAPFSDKQVAERIGKDLNSVNESISTNYLHKSLFLTHCNELPKNEIKIGEIQKYVDSIYCSSDKNAEIVVKENKYD